MSESSLCLLAHDASVAHLGLRRPVEELVLLLVRQHLQEIHSPRGPSVHLNGEKISDVPEIAQNQGDAKN